MTHDSLEPPVARRLPVIALLGIAVSLSWPTNAGAQQTNEQLAARCSELGAIFDRLGTRRGEGSGGPDMIRVGAGIDCQRGRYAQGIKALEDLLRRNRIPFPPA